MNLILGTRMVEEVFSATPSLEILRLLYTKVHYGSLIMNKKSQPETALSSYPRPFNLTPLGYLWPREWFLEPDVKQVQVPYRRATLPWNTQKDPTP